jgi:hypothetical protein
VRPRGTAERMPRHFFPTTCVEDCPGAHQSRASVKPVPSLRACGARPSAGGPSDREMALRGKPPGMALRGVFSEQLSPSFLGQLPHYAPCPELTVDIGARTLASLGKLWIVATEVTVSNLKFLAHGHGFLIRMSPALHLSPSGENPSLLSELIAGGTSGQRSSSPLDDIDPPKG